MKKLNLRLHLKPNKAAKLKGKFLTSKHYDQVIREDCDAYYLYGNLLFRFRKNAINMELLKLGYESFKDSIELTEGRGTASGGVKKRVLKDGTVSNRNVGYLVESGNVGFLDKGKMGVYCRKTAFARKYFDKYQQGIPFVQEVDRLYKELCPTHYERQINISRATDINYRIADTSFTTVTVNKNFRTATHQDSGDFREGFGNLIVYKEGGYDGGYFVLPEYRIAIDLQNTDVLFVDVHKWHGNTEFTNCTDDWLRVSFVMYYREYMVQCGSPTEELKRVKQEKTGYLKL